jgi:amino acid permease
MRTQMLMSFDCAGLIISLIIIFVTYGNLIWYLTAITKTLNDLIGDSVEVHMLDLANASAT